MSKKIIALSTMLLSVLLVLVTVETVTGRGLLEGQCTFIKQFRHLENILICRKAINYLCNGWE